MIFYGLFIISGVLNAQTTLTTGDIAVIRINEDGVDGFSIATLVDLQSGTSFFITEQGWKGDSFKWADNTEPHIQFTTNTNYPAGTIFHFDEETANQFSVRVNSNSTASYTITATDYNNVGGDQVIIYTGSKASPNFITALNSNDHGELAQYSKGTSDATTLWASENTAFLTTELNGTQTSRIPTGLTNGTNALSLGYSSALEKDNAYYTGTTTGTKSQLATAINTRSNWTLDDDAYTRAVITYTFTVEDEVSVTAPTVTTSAATAINATGATFSGNVTADGGATISERGFVYGTTADPTTANTKVQDGTGTGAFTENITGLTAGTTYYVRAYAINSAGTSYGNQVSFTTANDCTTPPDQDFGTYEDLSYGEEAVYQCITYFGSDSEVGIGNTEDQGIALSPVFSGSAAVIINNSPGGYVGFKSTSLSNFKLVSFAAEFFGHSNGKISETYEIKGYNDGIEVVSVSGLSVTASGSFGTGNSSIQWIRENFDVDGSNSGILTFGSGWGNIDEIRFYPLDASPNNNLYLGLDNINFEPAEIAPVTSAPSLTTSAATAITATGATFSGNVTADGGATVSERGFVYGTTSNPTTTNNKVQDGTGTGAFTENITGLTAGTTYYVRAYAINSAGTGYGSQVSFTTETASEDCSISSTVSDVADDYALFSQSVTACKDGKINSVKLLTNAAASSYPASTVTMTIREGNGLSGSILKTINIPTSIFKVATSLDDYITIDLSNENILVSDGSQYTFGFEGNASNRVQIYYSNNNPSASIYNGGQLYFNGTAVADRDLIFVMEIGPAAMAVPSTVTTSVATAITATGATFSGEVTADGGATVTERGFVYGITANPTTANTKVQDGTGTGTFTENITGLTAGTTYYVRAYAINSAGTSYGSQVSFTTSSPVSPSSNNALHFDSDAKITNLSGISPTSFTIEFWLKSQYQSPVDASKQYQGIYWQDSAPETGVYMDNYDVGSNYGTQTLAITPSASNTTTYQAWANGVDAGDISPTQQATWRHYAITSNGTSISFYYDGVLIRTQAYNGAVLPISNVTIGGTYGLNGYTLDELRIWNFAKTQTQIQAQKDTEVSPSSSGLVRYYNFNQGTANGNNTAVTSLPELTGNGTAATLSNFTLNGSSSNWVGGPQITPIEPVSNTAPTVTTSAATAITATGATFIGEVTADGGASVTERGFVYGTAANPTTANTKVTDGTGTGAFSEAITTLTAQTTYYVRAYAINSVGTSYGNEVSFTTSGAAVNNAPVISGLPATLTFTEDQQEAEMNLSSVTISDADAGSTDLTVTLTATSGTFDFATGTGVTFSGNFTNQITITGSLTNINNYLSQSSNTWYVPATNINGNNAATITFTVNDNDNTGTGGPNSTEGTININITPVNDAPIATELAISGTLNVGQTLTATYTYNDVENDTESGSTFKWYRSDDNVGLNKTAIANATSNTYTLVAADGGKYISFEVTPRDGTDFGSAVESSSNLVKIPITVTANASQTKVYGENDPILTYTVSPELSSGDTFTGTLTRATGVNVGSYAITQGTLSAGDKYLITYVSKDFSITAKPITVTAAAKNKTYGDADPAFTYTFAPALVTGDSFTGSLTRSAGENVGTYAINQGTLALSSNYTLTYVGADLTIAKKAITVTAAAKNKTYGDADPALTYTFAPALVTGDSFTGSLTRSAGEDVGTYAINQGTLALSSNYTLTYVGADLTIAKKAITVTAAAKNKTYGDVDPALTYTFAPALVTGDSFTGSLTRSAGENVGTYAINQGTLALSNNYMLTYVGADLTIAKKAITVTAAEKNKTYGDADPALTYTFVPALVTGDSFTGNLTRSAGEDVGTYAINQGTLALSSNYTLTYVGADLTIAKKAITVTAAAKNKTYGDVDPALTYTFAPALVTGDSFTGSLTRSAGEDVGTYAINQGTLALSNNYMLTYVGADLTIAKKAITVTAPAKNKTYGDADPALTYTFAPALVTGDSFTGNLTRSAGENVGTYAINQGTLALSNNYTLTYVGADLTIAKKAITVTAAAKNKTYGDADPALTYTFAPALVTGDSFSGSLTRSAGENVGTYAINQGTLALSSNYTLTYVGADLTIAKKAITVTAAAKNKTYGDVDPALTYTFAPALVTGDSFSGSLTRSAGENVGTYAINQGTLALSSNYTLTYVGADLTIAKKAITVTAAAKNKTYGDVDPALTYTFAPALVTGDSFTGSLTRSAGENVGTYAINQGTLALSNNYMLTYVGADLTIAKKAITVTAAAKNKTYGDADPALTYTFAPALVTGDSFTGSLTRSAGENVGTYAINQGTLALSNNYMLTYIGADLTIAKKAITVTAAAKNKTYGDVDPALTYTFAPALVTGDTFTGSLTRSAGENVGTYAINQGTLALSSNYTLTYVGADLTIAKKAITVTAAAKNKTYGDVDPALTYTFAPALVTGDSFTGSLTRSAGENVGTYAINQGTLALSSNYTLTYVGADLTIAKKAITVTAAAKNKTYGDADPALTYTFAPALVTGDSFSGSLTRSAGENVGTYAINQGTLALSSNYTLTYVGADLTIAKKAITVTAAAKNKTYGDADPALTYTFAPALVTGDSFSGSLTRSAGEDVGTYAINQGTLALSNNYTLTYVGADLTITKADQIITWNQTLGLGCDGETSLVLTATSTSGLAVNYTSSNTNIVTISNGLVNFQDYGAATITASQSGDMNYNAASNVVLPVITSQPNLIRKQFEDVIFFDNSSKNFMSYSWYKNGVLVPGQTNQYFKENGALNGTYYAVATKLDGTLITTCPLTLSPTIEEEYIKIAPNPVRSNGDFQLITNVNSSRLQNARIELYNITGNMLININTSQNTVDMKAPMVEGIYVIKMTLTNGKYFTKNLLVKN